MNQESVSPAIIAAMGGVPVGPQFAGEDDGSLRCSIRALDPAIDSAKEAREIVYYVILPTVDAVAYTAGDDVGGKLILNSVLTAVGGTARLKQVTIYDRANQKAAMDLVIWRNDPLAATITNNAAFTWGTSGFDAIARVAIAAADYVTLGTDTDAIATLNEKNFGNIELFSDVEATLYAALITSGTPTYAVGDLQLRLTFQRD